MVANELSGNHGNQATPTSRDHTASEGEEEEEEGEEEEEEEEGSCSSDNDGEVDGDRSEKGTKCTPHSSHPHTLTMPAKRGTEVRLVGLVMGEGVGVVRCDSVKVTLQCTRCRGNQDEVMRAKK